MKVHELVQDLVGSVLIGLWDFVKLDSYVIQPLGLVTIPTELFRLLLFSVYIKVGHD
jgi:hypothetical protein